MLEPSRLRIGQAVYDVADIEDRWFEGPRRAGGPSRQYFRVQSKGGSRFLVAHDLPQDAWSLIQALGPEVPPSVA